MATDRISVLDGICNILDANGIDIAELQEYAQAHATGIARPIVREYTAAFMSRLTTNTRRTWRTHIERVLHGAPPLCECLCDGCRDVAAGCTCACARCADQRVAIPALGDRPVSQATFTRSTVETVVAYAARHAAKVARTRNTRRAPGLALHDESGKGAAGLARDAVSSLLARAVDDGYLSTNVARGVRVKRNAPRPRALTRAQMLDVVDAAAGGGDDPDLDLLLVVFHYFTGARRSGAVDLRVGDLMPATGQIRLREKGDTDVLQPAPADLLALLAAHAIERGGERCDPMSSAYDPAAPVLYYRPRADGTPRPLTQRRYDTLFRRFQRTLEWAGTTRFTAHGLRYTAGVEIERRAGTAVARRFLRHAARTDTDRYTGASEAELYEAFEDFSGESHPLADE